MTEPNTEIATGRDSVEEAQGFSKMPMANPDAEKDYADRAYNDINIDDGLSAKEAAEALVNRRGDHQDAQPGPAPTQNPVVHRDYIHLGGEHAGEARPGNETVPIDRASRDLTGIREAEEAARVSAQEADLVRELTGEAQPEQPQSQPQQAPPEEPFFQEQQPVADPNADVVKLLEENPKLMAAIQAEYLQQQQQVEQARAAYVSGLQQNAQVALAAALAEFPEARSLTDVNQIPTMVNTVAARDPARAQAMVARVQQISAMAEAAQNASAQYQQQQVAAQQQAFSNFAKHSDDQFEKWFAQTEPNVEMRDRISKEARQMMQEMYSPQELEWHWNNNPAMRSPGQQQVMALAAQTRLAKRGVRDKVANPVPIVQRPGSPSSFGSQEDHTVRAASDRLSRSTGRAALEAARDLVVARRGRR